MKQVRGNVVTCRIYTANDYVFLGHLCLLIWLTNCAGIVQIESDKIVVG